MAKMDVITKTIHDYGWAFELQPGQSIHPFELPTDHPTFCYPTVVKATANNDGIGTVAFSEGSMIVDASLSTDLAVLTVKGNLYQPNEVTSSFCGPWLTASAKNLGELLSVWRDAWLEGNVENADKILAEALQKSSSSRLFFPIVSNPWSSLAVSVKLLPTCTKSEQVVLHLRVLFSRVTSQVELPNGAKQL